MTRKEIRERIRVHLLQNEIYKDESINRRIQESVNDLKLLLELEAEHYSLTMWPEESYILENDDSVVPNMYDSSQYVIWKTIDKIQSTLLSRSELKRIVEWILKNA